MPNAVTATVSSAADTFTPGISPRYQNPSCRLNVSIDDDSVWSGTIRLQRKLSGMTTWEDVETYTDGVQEFIEDHSPGTLYRMGSYAADWTAGEARLRLAKQK